MGVFGSIKFDKKSYFLIKEIIFVEVIYFKFYFKVEKKLFLIFK